MVLQILVEPLPSSDWKNEKKADKIKTWKDFGFQKIFLKLRKWFSNDDTKHEKIKKKKASIIFSTTTLRFWQKNWWWDI